MKRKQLRREFKKTLTNFPDKERQLRLSEFDYSVEKLGTDYVEFVLRLTGKLKR